MGMMAMYGNKFGKKPEWASKEWQNAAKVCTCNNEAEKSKDCCEAMVKAEQMAIEDCIGEPGIPAHTKIPPYNKEWGGPFTGPAGITKVPKGVPPFEGDFTDPADRIKYGIKTCCENK